MRLEEKQEVYRKGQLNPQLNPRQLSTHSHQEPMVDMRSFLIANDSLIYKKPRVSNDRNYLHPNQVNVFEATNHKLILAFKRKVFTSITHQS